MATDEDVRLRELLASLGYAGTPGDGAIDTLRAEGKFTGASVYNSTDGPTWTRPLPIQHMGEADQPAAPTGNDAVSEQAQQDQTSPYADWPADLRQSAQTSWPNYPGWTGSGEQSLGQLTNYVQMLNGQSSPGGDLERLLAALRRLGVT